MKIGIGCILGALALFLIPYLPVLAQDSDSKSITITMTGALEFSITVTPADWNPAGEGGKVSPNTPYETTLTYFTLTVDPISNCNVNTYIAGDDAVCASDSTYKWTLSSDGNNGEKMYVLWFKAKKDTIVRDYTLITKPEEGAPGNEFWPWSGSGYSYLTPGESVNFSLKLLTPQPDFGSDPGYFSVGDASVKTTITISGVAA